MKIYHDGDDEYDDVDWIGPIQISLSDKQFWLWWLKWGKNVSGKMKTRDTIMTKKMLDEHCEESYPANPETIEWKQIEIRLEQDKLGKSH